jgi:hypothetical protein
MFKEQISSTLGTRILCMRNKSHLLYGTRIVSEEQISSTQGTKNCVRGTNLFYPGNKIIVSKEQILATIWNKNCVRGTNLVNTGNKNKDLVNTRNKKIVFKEQISSTLETRILCLRNKSHLLYGTRLALEEQISSTQGTRIKISSTEGTKNCVQGTNLVYPRNKNIVFEEHLSIHRRNKNSEYMWKT